jgi:toxin ParE1/3/4
MRRRVLIRDAAENDIDQIARFIAQQNLSAALRFYDAVDETLTLLARMPRVGKQRTAIDPSLKGLRSWSVKWYRNYLIFYLPLNDGIDVVRVVHGSRDLPRVIGLHE